jgi:hypothetical protein
MALKYQAKVWHILPVTQASAGDVAGAVLRYGYDRYWPELTVSCNLKLQVLLRLLWLCLRSTTSAQHDAVGTMNNAG